MTNGEKYRTAQERAEAFGKWCNNYAIAHGDSCDESENCMLCQFAWLDLEAEKGKLLPCPFCGNDNIKFSIVEDSSDQYMACPQVFCNRCGATIELGWSLASDLGTTVTDEQKSQLLSKWNNRVAKKSRESEVK